MAMERYREAVVERMEQLGDSPRPQQVVRAHTALHTLLGDIFLQPIGDHLVARVEMQNQALALLGGALLSVAAEAGLGVNQPIIDATRSISHKNYGFLHRPIKPKGA